MASYKILCNRCGGVIESSYDPNNPYQPVTYAGPCNICKYKAEKAAKAFTKQVEEAARRGAASAAREESRRAKEASKAAAAKEPGFLENMGSNAFQNMVEQDMLLSPEERVENAKRMAVIPLLILAMVCSLPLIACGMCGLSWGIIAIFGQ